MQPEEITFEEVAGYPVAAKKRAIREYKNIGNVFTAGRRSFINEFHLFTATFNAIPNFIEETKINCKKANLWFKDNYGGCIKDSIFSRVRFDGSRESKTDDLFYFLYDDLIVNFDTQQSVARFLFRETPLAKVEEIVRQIKQFRKRKSAHKPEIWLIVNGHRSLDTMPLSINRLNVNIRDNYNDDFQEIHQTIINRLSRKNDKGLVLLHGKPGTGKTSYIRHLICSLRKNVIFLPPNMAESITNPQLLTILTENPDSVFVIEDAENIVIDRAINPHSPVSALLNISDGLLSDCLNIQIICSFNIDISKVDSALLRKGRLIAKYEFKELEIDKANALSKKLGFDGKFDAPVTLTAVYNQGEKDFQGSKSCKSIGFKA